MEAPRNNHTSCSGSSEGGSTTQSSGASSGMQCIGLAQDAQKMKPCSNGQCGSYEGFQMSLMNGHGHCQPPCRMYPYMQQQQHAMAVRAAHPQHNHYHPGSVQPCHSSHPVQSYVSATNTGPIAHPHLDRMMHHGTSGVAPAAQQQQLRSIVMNHFPSSPGYTYAHPQSAASNNGYYPQSGPTNTGVSANGHCVDYSHVHNNPIVGPVSNNSPGSSVPYTQQQRSINSVPAASSTTYRPMQNPNVQHSKMMTSTQAAFYQSAYHQYAQYVQHQHGLVHTHQPHGTSVPINGAHDRMFGAHNMTSQQYVHQQQQQQSRLLQFMTTRPAQPQSAPHLPPQPHNSVYPSSCTTQMMPNPNCLLPPPPPSALLPQHTSEFVIDQTRTFGNREINIGAEISGTDKVTKSDGGSETESSKSAKLSTKNNVEKENNNCTSLTTCEEIKLKSTSPEKAVKVKKTKSATKLRDRQPKLIVGKKKKGITSSGIVSGRKHKSLLKGNSSSSINSIGGGSESSPLVKKPSSSKTPVPVIECIRAGPLCPPRPPPGFEHLKRPQFPVELCDPSLLGNLVGSQLSREAVSSVSGKKYFGEETFPCCQKDPVNVGDLWETTDLKQQQNEDSMPDDWDTLNNAIRNVIDDWTEELNYVSSFEFVVQDDNKTPKPVTCKN